MQAPILELRAGERLLRSIELGPRPLLIGRGTQNDVVLVDPAVSRVHARLDWRDGVCVLEDLQSANGCFVNGERVRTSCLLSPGDEVTMGDHRLRLRAVDPARATGDARAELAGDARVELAGVAHAFDIAEDEAREDDECPAAVAPHDPVRRPSALSNGDAPCSEIEAEGAAGAKAERRLHAGLVLQHGGRIERVLCWDRDRLSVGRAAECDLVLDSGSVSRRHALLLRQGDVFEVRDLDSANGTRVNGEKVSRRVLTADDVIGVGDFELTLLLDEQPLGSEVVLEELGAALPTRGESRFDMTFFGEVGESLGVSQDPAFPESVVSVEPAEESFFDVHADSGAASQPLAGLEAADGGVAPDEDSAGIALELLLDVEALPEPLRAWLRSVEGEIRLPVALRIRRSTA